MKLFPFLILSSLLIISSTLSSQDTFSIVAVDTITGELGSAGASCIGAPQIPQGCYILSDVLPGIGVIHTQASYNAANQNYARSLMLDGVSPDEMIELLVENDVGNNPGIRQYGIVDFYTGSPRTAAYTGANCLNYKNHIVGPNYTIQGNILLGQQILDSMEARFLSTEGELACKLMAAMQGAKVVGADTRCLNAGISSLSAFIRVAKPDDPADELYLDINIPSTTTGVDPIDSLQVLFEMEIDCVITGIYKPSKTEKFSVFPNPAGEVIHIEFDQLAGSAILIEIYDLAGNKVISLQTENKKQLQIKHQLPPGIYSCLIREVDGTTHNQKLIIF
jgi:uncharacterized Ntn-hydrolase superfamily protein